MISYQFSTMLQKQSSGGVLWKRCPYKFRKIHRKTPVPESLFKETLAQVFSCEFCEIYKNIFFYRTPLVAAFDVILAQADIFARVCWCVDERRRVCETATYRRKHQDTVTHLWRILRKHLMVFSSFTYFSKKAPS